MDSGDMSSREMRQAQSNFPESPDLAAGCQNFFPRESFGLPDPAAAEKCLDGQTNNKRENGKEDGGELCGCFGQCTGCSCVKTCCQPLSDPASPPLWWLMLVDVVCGCARRSDLFTISSSSNTSVLHSRGRSNAGKGDGAQGSLQKGQRKAGCSHLCASSACSQKGLKMLPKSQSDGSSGNFCTEGARASLS